MRLPAKHPWFRYQAWFEGRKAAAAAFLAGIAAALVVWSLHIGFPKDGFLFVYMPVISAVAYLGGRGPGLATTLASLLTAWYFIIPPPYSFALRADTVPILALFALGGLLAVEWAAHLRRIEAASRSLARIVESSDDAILGIDAGGTIRTWNPGAERLYGYRAEEAVGQPLAMLVPAGRRGEIADILARLRQGEPAKQCEIAGIAADQTPLDLSLTLSPMQDDFGRIVGASAIARDITERKRTLARVSRLYETTAALSGALTPEAVAEVCVKQAVNALGATAGSLSLLSEDERELEMVHAVGYPEGFVPRWKRAATEDRAGAAAAIRTRQPQFFASRAALADLYAGRRLPPSILSEPGARAVLPLLAGRRVAGIISLVFRSPRLFADEDRQFTVALARQCAQALERARLYQREHATAVALQRALLPAELPVIPELRVDAAYKAGGRETDVGGDWYDVFQLPDGRVMFCVGDVIGRGLRAATVMGELRHTIRALALEGHSPSDLLHRAHRVLRNSYGSDVLATAALAILQPADLSFSYSSAGHPPPVVARGDGSVEWLSNGWVPLGAHYPGHPPERSVRLGPGDLVVFYTDGLTEETRDLVEGEERLLAAVRDERERGSESPAHAILHAVLGTAVPKDDVAVLTIAPVPAAGGRIEMTIPATPEAVTTVRHAFRRAAAAFGLHGDAAFGLEVALGEALNNAVEHAYGLERGPVSVRVWREGSDLTIEVQDQGRWRPERNEGRGRGRAVMAALVDRVDIDRRDTGTVVRLTTRLDRDTGLLSGAQPLGPVTGRPEDAGV